MYIYPFFEVMKIVWKDQEIYDKTKEFVIASFEQANKASKINHLLRTWDIVNILKPDAGMSLLTAAISHDIEKAFRMPDALKEKEWSGLIDLKFLRIHEERWAEIIWNFLNDIWAKEQFIEEVKKMIARHEEGGEIHEEDINVLQAADSVSFFEDEELWNIEKMLKKEKTPSGIDDVKAKVRRMYERIKVPQAKAMATPWYEKAIQIMANF